MTVSERNDARPTLARIAAIMSCEPEDVADLVEAVALLVQERDDARALVDRLRADPRLACPVDGPGSHRLDLAEMRLAKAEVERLREALTEAECNLRGCGFAFEQTGLKNTAAVARRAADAARDAPLVSEVKRLRAALAWYGDLTNYGMLANGTRLASDECNVMADDGRRARRALAFGAKDG